VLTSGRAAKLVSLELAIRLGYPGVCVGVSTTNVSPAPAVPPIAGPPFNPSCDTRHNATGVAVTMYKRAAPVVPPTAAPPFNPSWDTQTFNGFAAETSSGIPAPLL